MLFPRLKRLARNFKHELIVYKLVLRDKRTPLFGKILLSLAVGYAIMPFDLIPDFIPVLGHFDDMIIIPLLVIFALKVIPREIMNEHREKVRRTFYKLP